MSELSPEEKTAAELIMRFDRAAGTYSNDLTRGIAIRCALIAVDELQKQAQHFLNKFEAVAQPYEDVYSAEHYERVKEILEYLS